MSMSLRNTLLAFSLSALSAMASADVVFDNITTPAGGDGTLTATSSTPNTFMGDGYVLVANTTQITGFDLFAVNLAGTTFTNLKINVWVWGGVNMGAVSAATPAFSNLLRNFTITSEAGSFDSGAFYSFEDPSDPGVTPGVTLGTPINLTSTTIGLTFNIQGSTDGGLTYASVNSLTSLIRGDAAPDVGSQVFSGYYRNANSETNGNFTSALRSLGGVTDQSLAVRIYGNVGVVPEPSTMLMLSAGIMGLLAWRRRQA